MKTCDAWRDESPHPGMKTRLQDGQVWRTVPGPDGVPFFDNTPDRPNADELRIGILLGFDGCVHAVHFVYIWNTCSDVLRAHIASHI